MCLSKCELCGLKQPSGCSSGERTVQAGHLQGQVHTAGGQQLRRLCVPGQQLQARSPVRVHGDARPQQRPSPRCVPSVLTVRLDFLSSWMLPSSLKLFIRKCSAFSADSSRVSFEAAHRPNFFLRTSPSGQLRLAKWEETEAFWDAATFILRRNTWMRGYDSLESLSKPSFFLHASLARLHLLRYRHTDSFRKATLFRLTGEQHWSHNLELEVNLSQIQP